MGTTFAGCQLSAQRLLAGYWRADGGGGRKAQPQQLGLVTLVEKVRSQSRT